MLDFMQEAITEINDNLRTAGEDPDMHLEFLELEGFPPPIGITIHDLHTAGEGGETLHAQDKAGHVGRVWMAFTGHTGPSTSPSALLSGTGISPGSGGYGEYGNSYLDPWDAEAGAYYKGIPVYPLSYTMAIPIRGLAIQRTKCLLEGTKLSDTLHMRYSRPLGKIRSLLDEHSDVPPTKVSYP